MNREKYQLLSLANELYLALAPIECITNQSRRTAEVNATHELLSLSLGSLGLSDEARLEHTDSGAPVLVGLREELSVSISHCEEWVAVLLGPKELNIGIDIEPRRRQVERVEHKFVSEEESALLDNLGSQRLLGLQLLWSAKEALYKCIQPPTLSLLAFELKKIDISRSQVEPKGALPIGSVEYTAKITFLYQESNESRQELNVEGLACADHVLCYTYYNAL